MAEDPKDKDKPIKYRALKKAVRTKGMQPGEEAVLKRVMANRDVSRAEAIKIARRRTAKGLNVGRVQGPKGPKIKTRKPPSADASGGRGTNDPTPTKGDLAIPQSILDDIRNGKGLRKKGAPAQGGYNPLPTNGPRAQSKGAGYEKGIYLYQKPPRKDKAPNTEVGPRAKPKGAPAQPAYDPLSGKPGGSGMGGGRRTKGRF